MPDNRNENQKDVARHRYGLCEICDSVLDFDQDTREIYCPVGPEVHPTQLYRRRLPPEPPQIRR